jgi:hypothetical protein
MSGRRLGSVLFAHCLCINPLSKLIPPPELMFHTGHVVVGRFNLFLAIGFRVTTFAAAPFKEDSGF